MPRRTTRVLKKAIRATEKAEDQVTALYTPLITERKEIRLVTLCSGNFEDDIFCSLSKVSLDDKPSYEALSYVWGDRRITRRIFIDGLSKRVTRNLEIALRHLRYDSRPRVLWIDAICINQRNIAERSVQVMHMDEVYAKATSVIAWLGEESNDSNLAFDALNALPTVLLQHWDPQKNAKFDMTALEPKFTSALRSLFLRPWWRRIWTVQESILGPAMSLICGKRQVSADTSCSVAFSQAYHSRACCRRFLLEHLKDNAFWDLLEGMDPLYHLGMWRNEHCDHRLVCLLAHFRSRFCLDPRDKVYGLLGLCISDEKNLVVPDYSLPASVVYEQATFKMIERSLSLEVFSQLCPRSIKSTGMLAGKLPSWVPDWTSEITSYDHAVLIVRQERAAFDFKASASTFTSARQQEQGKLSLNGILLDSIAVLIIGQRQASHLRVTIDCFKEMRDLAGVEDFPDRLYGTKTSTYYDAFWQTLCSSILPSRSNLTENADAIRASDDLTQRSWHDAWWDWVLNLGTDDERADLVNAEFTGSELNAFDRSVGVSTCLRNFFLSKDKQWMGFIPIDAEIGDIIALLEGGRVPYILRPKTGVDKGRYELIGDAYVHGIMDGEGWSPDLLQEIVLV
ncbi:heterokaryon incompatibility protein-domain-containing protein [Leptodontidium sp. 2 PMI_412]|nr:heterokaryon incompatibility protein-domain-containing protein [Leptodontidium sp. 2 PMI_412]